MITPEQAEIIEKAFDSVLLDVHTMLPVIVESVNTTEQTVEIVSQLKRPIPKGDGSYILEDLPKMLARIGLPRTAAGHFISFPIDVGCYGRVNLCEADFGQWVSLGKTCNPSTTERFSLSSGLFTPDLWPNSGILPDTLTNDLVMGVSGATQLRFKGATAEVTSSGAIASTDFVAMSTVINTFLNSLAATVSPLGVSIITPAIGAPCPVATAIRTAMTNAFPPLLSPAATGSTNLKAD